MKKTFICLLHLAFMLQACGQQDYDKEGIVILKNYYSGYEDSLQLPFVHIENKVWFKDSVVVIERKSIVTLESENKYSRNTVVYKYTLLDLKTMICEDYEHFSDTATLLGRYRLAPGEFFDKGLFLSKKESDVSGDMVDLPDTTINGKQYKRIKVNYEGYHQICYFENQWSSNLFHINRTLNEKYDGYFITKTELKANGIKGSKWFEMFFLQHHLDSNSSKVIDKWIQNSQTVKMPVQTLQDIDNKGYDRELRERLVDQEN